MAKCEKAQEDYVSAMTHSNRELTDDDKEWIVRIIKVFNGIYDECKLFISMHGEMKFEPFSGELRKYPRFKEEFLKHIKPRYESQEAFVLKSYLAPDIKEAVDNYGDSAVKIWKRLARKYNDKSKMVDSIVTDIKQVSNSTDDPSEILHMIKVIERACRDLKSMGLEKEINNTTIVSMIEQKLLAEVEKEWIKIVTGEKRSELSENKFPTLLELLLQFKERIEYQSASLRARSSVEGDVNAINEGPIMKSSPPDK